MQVIYTSPVFKDVIGTARRFRIPLAALATYTKRDQALLACLALGGIHAKPTAEFLAHRRAMLSAKRKIQREGWFCETVE